jgi:hypothetical protein
MILVWLSVIAIVLALIPAATFLANFSAFLFAGASSGCSDADVSVSVLIPARNEAAGIAVSIDAILGSEAVEVEVLVLDDQSTDSTAAIVAQIASRDGRVGCLAGKPLPPGWNGKQHACLQLAEAAKFPRLVFIDADVRLRPSALRRLAERQDESEVALLSAFPRQQTGTLLEKMIIPLMHFILLGFLPLSRMRASTHPAYAAGCGQLFITRRPHYEVAGTHAAIAASRHDGLKLPRAYREAGLMTDLIDGTDLAECRMYHNASEVIRGVLKNAIEGIASPKLILPFSIILLGGSVLPVVTFVCGILQGSPVIIALSAVGVAVGHLPRALAAIRLRQSWIGVALHSIGVLLFVLLQWVALANHLLGRQVAWRGRIESADQAMSTT